jgi:MoxR-like ATPase
MTDSMSASDRRTRIAAQVVGREHELELLLAAVSSRRDVVLEGPPGTSKTTMLKAITDAWGIPLLVVEGNSDLTPGRLVGHHNPARVLREDYSADTFVPGPLVQAMKEGGFLYIEEFNRAPEDTLNALLMAIADRRISVPRVGTIAALPTFRLIASMNPYDNVGTVRLSASVHDRLCRVSIGYQDAESERAVVALRTAADAGHPQLDRLIGHAVEAVRATRAHADIRQGSSVRGAIDTVQIGRELLGSRAVAEDDDAGYGACLLDALFVALSGRIHLDEVADTTAEQILREIWEDLMVLASHEAAPG